MIDTKELLQTVDLASLIESDLGQPGKKSGRYLFWHCPLHSGDNSPSFSVTPDNGRYHCFGCGKSGDAITWLREYHKLPFRVAIQRLSKGLPLAAIRPARYEIPQHIEKRLPDELQESWKRIIETCQDYLWSNQGAKAWDWLHKRGLKDKTLQSHYWRVGYSPGVKIAGVYVERGIVLPCFTTTKDKGIDYVQYIKVRRPVGEPKYKKLPGNGADLHGLYGAPLVMGSEIIFMVEGELDCLLLDQEAGDLVGVATLGGAGDRLDFSRFGKYLIQAKHIIVCYDTDQAGDQGTAYWKGLSQRVYTVKVPQGKDISEYYQSGGNLPDWVVEIIKENRLI